ncbi:MAG: CGNR zinc finger domain-containing protein [Streptosporangiaceae bacterium]
MTLCAGGASSSAPWQARVPAAVARSISHEPVTTSKAAASAPVTTRQMVDPRTILKRPWPWHLHLTQGGTVAGRYAAEATMGLATLLTRLGPERLGICQGLSCGRVLIETDIGRSGRHCSDGCASRTNVTKLRKRRHRAAI